MGLQWMGVAWKVVLSELPVILLYILISVIFEGSFMFA
jgi:hypothetical protein